MINKKLSSLKITQAILRIISYLIFLSILFNLMIFVKAWIVIPDLRQFIKENAQVLFIFFYLLAFAAWLCNSYAKIIKNKIKCFDERNKEE
jgi:glucan phosphoethanolaminetransferase (alkaline phosphatase superfamily)